MKKGNLFITALTLLIVAFSMQANVTKYARCALRPGSGCSVKDIKRAQKWLRKTAAPEAKQAAKKAGINVSERDVETAKKAAGTLGNIGTQVSRYRSIPNW